MRTVSSPGEAAERDIVQLIEYLTCFISTTSLGGQGLGISEVKPVFEGDRLALNKRGHLGVLLRGHCLVRFIFTMIVWCYSFFITDAIGGGGGGSLLVYSFGCVGSSSKSTIRREQSKTRSGSSLFIDWGVSTTCIGQLEIGLFCRGKEKV